MAVSANTLFHFTKEDSLKNILSSMGFYVQYSEEHFENISEDKGKYGFAYIPMISFCDLTVMQLSVDGKHRMDFGEYGIGLTKEWGIKNRVSPVIYTHEKSQPTSQLYNLNLLLKAYSKKGKFKSKFAGIQNELIDFFKFVKPYTGRWHRGEEIPKNQKDVLYYNEREWRYCPLLDEYKVLFGATKRNKQLKEQFNNDLKSSLIKFEPKDIKYIVIKKKSQINDYVKLIRDLKLSDEDENWLLTNIITFEGIEEDF